MNENKKCLNCDESIINKFCSFCGQKTNTNRITFKSLITHDIIHGVWHLERGILYTIKESLLRPGKAALNYISGKRIRFYNIFYLILIIVGLNILVGSTTMKLDRIYFPDSKAIAFNNSNNKLQNLINDNAKIILLIFIPLFAINSFIIFNKKKLNFGEHFIIAGVSFLGIMVITLIGNSFYFFGYLKYISFLTFVADYLTPISILVYLFFSYYSTFFHFYSKKGTVIRVILFIFLLLFEIITFLKIQFFLMK